MVESVESFIIYKVVKYQGILVESFVMYRYIQLPSRAIGAQLLSGRALDLRPKGRVFKPLQHHCVVSLSKTLILAQCWFNPGRPVLT